MFFFGGSKRSHSLPLRFGGNFPSNVGWETDHLAAMNGPIFRCEITGPVFLVLGRGSLKKNKHRLFAISDFKQNPLCHDSYDLQDPDMTSLSCFPASPVPFMTLGFG